MGFAEDLPSADDEAPRQSTIGLSGYSTPSVPTFLPQAPTNLLSSVKGKDLFDATIWKDKKSTQTHYTFITSLKHKIDEVQDTSEVHKFIRVLRDGGRLVRNYTQNIDMLEKREGLCTDLSRGVGSKGRFNPKLRKESREGQDHEGGKFDNGVEVVQLHGNLEYLRCTLCLKLCDWEEDDRHLTMLSGEAPPCPHCIKKTETRQEKGRRGLSVGTLRPDIVLYGENNPHDAAIGDVSTHDIKIGPDMCIILGTSLKVHGLKLLLREFSKAVHDRGGKVIFVNNTKPSDSIWGEVIDYWVEWDCDAWVRDVKARRGGIWAPQGSSPETTPKLQYKQLPGYLPKSQQPKLQNGRKVQLPIPKHPQCMRIDYFCGAFIMDKIQRILRAKSGRGDDGAETKAIHARIDQINHQLMRSGKAAEKLALGAAEAALEALKTVRRERKRIRRAEKRALDREAAKELEEEANDEAAAAQLHVELELPVLSELPNMWNTTVQAMRKITCDPAWDSSHPIQPNTFEMHRLLAEHGWTYPSERDAAHAQRLADLVKDHERLAGERAPARLESQAILLPDCNITGKRKRETPSAPPSPLPRPTPAREQFSMPLSSPASLASDKSNMAHITWNILGIVSQEAGRQRKLPETIAGQRTLFAELGREFTELPPPPTPAAAYELSNWSISSPRPVTPAAQNLPVASPSSASSLGSQDPKGSNRDHIRSVFDLEHSHGMVPRLPRMGALAHQPTRADNTRYAVRYMSTTSTPSAREKDVPLSSAEPQLNAQAGMEFSPPSASFAAPSSPPSILPQFSKSFAPTLAVTPDADTFTGCYRVGRASRYTRPQENTDSKANAAPVYPANSTPLEITQPLATGVLNRPQSNTAPALPMAAWLSATCPPQPNTTSLLNTRQSMTPSSMAPLLPLTGEIYVPPYDITRAAQFGMTPKRVPFHLQYEQLPTPAPTPPMAAVLGEKIVKLQREIAEHRDTVNFQGRAWTLLEIRHDERKDERVAELEDQLRGAGQKRFLTPPDSDDRSQVGSQCGGSQQSQPGYAARKDFQPFTAEQLKSSFPAVREEGRLAVEEVMEPPMTPEAKRTKSMGSVEAILSSPPPVPPTLSKETEKLMDDETGDKVDRHELMQHAKEQQEPEEEYPAV